ncbi:MAG: hypothetical protein WDO24_01255 [Pseudomonadota bacterium]
MLRQWVSFGTVQRRVIDSIAAEIRRAAADIATETGAVTAGFQDVAGRAAAQSRRVDSLAGAADTLTIDGRDLPLSEVAAWSTARSAT